MTGEAPGVPIFLALLTLRITDRESRIQPRRLPIAAREREFIRLSQLTRPHRAIVYTPGGFDPKLEPVDP